ncbi:MAG TPA: FlgD immunoglobulin-like domain containing protein, partial [Gaiellaceae bacterium]|nr:FlgD immunoglobulin-like domain containing protein [Gaiellaceae bacterium]
ETQELSYKVVRPSTVTATLTAPDGSIAWQEAGAREPGVYEVAFPPLPPPPPEGQPPPEPTTPAPPAEGRWSLTVTSLDDQGLTSTTTRRFAVNSTLASLRAPVRIVVRSSGGRADVRWAQARAARVKVTVESPEGILVRTLASSTLQPGEQAVVWDGRGGDRKPVGGGSYVIRVTATNELGTVSLAKDLVVRRVAR